MTPTSPRSYYHQTFPLIPAWRGALRFSNDPVKSADFRFWHKADVERTLWLGSVVSTPGIKFRALRGGGFDEFGVLKTFTPRLRNRASAC
jgi:hypothetical protein